LFAAPFWSVVFGSAAFGSVEFGAGLAAAALVLAADEAADFALPDALFAIGAADERDVLRAEAVPDADVPWTPLPLCVFDPAAFELFAFPAGGCDGAAAAVVEPALPLLSVGLGAAPELVVPAGACCAAGGGLAGAGGGTLLFAGAVTPASSKAAKGWLSIFWFCADAVDGDAVDETAGEALGATLGTLGTVELRRTDSKIDCLLATGRPGRLS
jgi:hypothetical protein